MQRHTYQSVIGAFGQSPRVNRWVWSGVVAIAMLTGGTAQGQVIPDATLGAGNNSVTSTTGNRTDILGGLRRNSSLFHSFDRFDVLTNQQVYFANPADIRNIFSRVTGGNISNIDGLLGVSGNANLFFMNPNGIIFGPNARLDVAGSFLATTANALEFADNQRFAATGDRTVPLVEVNIPIGVQFGANPPAMLTNRGNLTAGQNLTLAAGNLDLQGQVRSGGDLTLNATDTVRIRDTVTEPFLARSGENLTIQGNQGIDILVLNHLSQTPFVSGGNLSLIGNGIISGDAHYEAGGSFSILNTTGGIGDFFSIYDPTVTAAGNVTFGNYTGASLQVISGGSISTGSITINAIDPALDPNNPVLILRAGVAGNPNNPAFPFLSGGANFTTAPATAPAGITVGGNITTTLIQPFKITLNAPGDISTRDIIATSSSATDYARIDLRSTEGSVILNNARISASNTDPNILGGAGDVFINAALRINITNGSSIESNGDLGRIFLDAGEQLTVDKSSLSAINNSATANGTGGQILINVPGTAITPGRIIITKSSLRTPSSNQAPGGRISMTAGNTGSIAIDSTLVDSSISGGGNPGNGISLNAPNGDITLNTNSLITTGTAGTAGTTGNPINVLSGTVTLNGSSALSATTSNTAPGGAITVTADAITVNTSSLISTNVQSNAAGAGGDIALITSTLNLQQGGRVEARTFGNGRGGNIQLNVATNTTISGFDDQLPPALQSQLYSGISTDARGTGPGGNITFNNTSNRVSNLSISNRGFLSARTTSDATSATGGNIDLNVNALDISGGGQVLTTSSSFADAGSITVNAVNDVTISGSGVAPTAPNSIFENPVTFTILELDGRIPNAPTLNSLVEQSDTIPFISLQRTTGPGGSILANPNPDGTVAGGTGGTVLGGGSDFDYYGFTVTQDGSRAIFDVDNNVSNPASAVDTQIFLFDAQTGQLLGSNDDFFPATAGSTSSLDSRLAFNFNSAGRYVLGVGRFPTSAANNTPLTGTALATTDAYRMQVSVQNSLQTPGTLSFNVSDRNPNQGLNSGLFSNVQPPVDLRVPGRGVGNDITVITQAGQINLSDGALINASTAGLGGGGDVLLQTGGGSVSVTSGARVETRTTGVGNVFDFGGNAGNITIAAPDITVAGANQVNGQPVFSGLLASSDTAKSGVGGAIFINSAVNPGNILRVADGGFLSTLNRSDQNGQGIEVNVANVQLLTGGQIITAAEGIGRAGGITINSPNVQISGTNAGFLAPPPLPNGSGTLPWVPGGQTIDFNALSSTSSQVIDFSTTVPHVTIQGQGGAYDFYRLDSVIAGNRIVADIDNDQVPAGSFDTEIFLFDSAGNLLTRNDDSRAETGRGSVSGRDSYIDYTFTAPGSYYVAVGRFPSNPVPGQVPPNQALLTGTVPGATDQYTLQLSVDRRNTFNPNSSASSGLFAQSSAGEAGNITVNGGGSGQITLGNSAQIVADTSAGGASSPANITLQGLQTLNVNNSLISSSTSSGTAGSVTVNATRSVSLDGTFIDDGTVQGGITATARQGGNAGSVRITTPTLAIANNASVAVSSANGAGTAGSVDINASTVTLNNAAQISAETDAGGAGNPANITLQGLQSLNVNNSQISSSTRTGQAGNLAIDATGGTVDLNNNSRLTVAATNGGTAGNLTVTAGRMRVNRSIITVSSPTGPAGNLTLTTPDLRLDRGTLSAETGGNGSGANITLAGLQAPLFLRNGSLISANAGAQANGGNITIGDRDSGIFPAFIIGPTFENNDIVANAVAGNGGKINITTNAIFGLQFRRNRTPRSDITASSETGFSGTVALNTLNIDPSKGLVELPEIPVDRANQLTQGCSTGGDPKNNESRFSVAGRGGVPVSPTAPLAAAATANDWVSLDTSPQALSGVTFSNGITMDLVAQSDRIPVTCVNAWKLQQRSPLPPASTSSPPAAANAPTT